MHKLPLNWEKRRRKLGNCLDFTRKFRIVSHMQHEKLIAKFILFCAENGIELKSPYDIENLCTDVLSKHDNLKNFFAKWNEATQDYDDLNPVDTARRVLNRIVNEEFVANAQKAKDELRSNDKYAEGYQTGLNWKDTYVPGGPCCFAPKSSDSPKIAAMFAKTVIAHRAWMLGFHEGYDKNPNPKIINYSL